MCKSDVNDTKFYQDVICPRSEPLLDKINVDNIRSKKELVKVLDSLNFEELKILLDYYHCNLNDLVDRMCYVDGIK